MMTMSKAMREPVSMRWRRWIILALLPLVAACSALRLSYNQGPVLLYWWLDGYVDFRAEQSGPVKAAIEDWFDWHRASQLPDYAQALASLQAMAVDKLTPAQICSTAEAWQQRAELAYGQALPPLTTLVRTLSPEQIRQIEKRYAVKQAEAVADYLQAVPAERQKAAFERSLDRAETLYGKLDAAQRQRLAADLAVSSFDPERWLNERAQRQQDILRSLRQWQAERSDAATVQAGLQRLGAAALRSPRADYQTYANALQSANCALVAGLHNSTTPAQRRHAVAKLKGWEDDLQALIRR
jgi:hypothetical protein